MVEVFPSFLLQKGSSNSFEKILIFSKQLSIQSQQTQFKRHQLDQAMLLQVIPYQKGGLSFYFSPFAMINQYLTLSMLFHFRNLNSIKNTKLLCWGRQNKASFATTAGTGCAESNDLWRTNLSQLQCTIFLFWKLFWGFLLQFLSKKKWRIAQGSVFAKIKYNTAV